MDRNKFEQKMKERKISKEEMHKELGISRSAFYRKCNGTTQFTLEEIQAIVEILQLETPIEIFFADKVS